MRERPRRNVERGNMAQTLPNGWIVVAPNAGSAGSAPTLPNGWTITPPQQKAYPNIEGVYGEGSADRLKENRAKFGGYGFTDELVGPIADEIGAFAGATGASIASLAQGEVPSWGGLYDEYLDIEREDQKRYREENPAKSIGANVLGGFTAAPTRALTAAGAAMSTGGRVVQGMKAGAIGGALAGAAEGEGGVVNRAESAAVGGALGVFIGGSIPALADAAKGLWKMAGRAYGLTGKAAQQRAEQMLTEALKRDGVDINALVSSGKPITAADLGENTRALLGSAMRMAGDAKTPATEFLTDRSAGQFERMSGDIAQGLGVSGDDFARVGADVAGRRAAAAGPGYDAAYAQAAPQLSKTGRRLLETPAGKQAVAVATRFMGNRRRPVTDASGNYTVEMLDQIQRAMRDASESASGARMSEKASNVGAVRDRFIAELPDDLRKVMSDYAGESALLRAMENGRKFLRGDTDDVGRAIADLSPQELEMFRLGAAKQLREQMGNIPDQGDAARLFKRPNVRERLSALFPDQQTFAQFMARVDDEINMQSTTNDMLRGSQTAPRMAADEAFANDAGREQMVKDIAHGKGFIATAIDEGFRRAGDVATRVGKGVNREVADDLLRMGVIDTPAVTASRLNKSTLNNFARQQMVPFNSAGPRTPGGAGAAAAGARVLTPDQARSFEAIPSSEPKPEGAITGSNWRVVQPKSPFKLAQSFVGLQERRDQATIASFIKKASGQSLDPTKTAWCAAFVNAVLSESGHDGTGKLNARSFLDYGMPIDQPTQGDIVVFWRDDPESWKGHVGFFAGRETKGGKEFIKVLGGNQDDRVSVKLYPADRLLGARRPPRIRGA